MVAWGEPAERRIEGNQVERAVDIAEHVAVPDVDPIRDPVALHIGLGRLDCSRVDVHCNDIRGLGRRQDRVDSAAGPHVEHPVTVADLG